MVKSPFASVVAVAVPEVTVAPLTGAPESSTIFPVIPELITSTIGEGVGGVGVAGAAVSFLSQPYTVAIATAAKRIYFFFIVRLGLGTPGNGPGYANIIIKILHVEAEMHYIPIFNNVFFALDPQLTGFACG